MLLIHRILHYNTTVSESDAVEICFIIIQHILIRLEFTYAPFKGVSRFCINYKNVGLKTNLVSGPGMRSPHFSGF